MISQTDAATTTLTLTDPAQQSLTNSNLTGIGSPQSRSNTLNSNTPSPIHNGKSSKTAFGSVKKRKRFDETVIDGFAIIAFKTWEDLQDELNERNSIIINTNNNSILAGGTTNLVATTTTNKCTTDATSTNKKAGSRSKSKSSSNLLANNSDTSSLSSASSETTQLAPVVHSTAGHKEVTSSSNNSNKKKDKIKKSAGHQTADKANQLTKDKRNKTSSEKNSLKRAIEAKDLAEKRLSILQEKLEQEQSRNRSLNHDTTSITATSNLKVERYDSPQSITAHIVTAKEEQQHQHQHQQQQQQQQQHQQQQQQQQQHLLLLQQHHSSGANGVLGQNVLKDPNQAPKPMPYSPFHINSHLHRQDVTAIHNQMHTHHAPKPPTSPPRIQQSTNMHQHQSLPTQHQHPMKHSNHHIHQQHRSTPPPVQPPMNQQPSIPTQLSQQQLPMPTQPTTHLLHQAPPPLPQSQSALHPSHPYYHKQPQLSSHHPHAHLLQHQPTPQNPLNPYSHQPPSSIMSSMGLSSLPSPYSCPPSTYIIDTISRQTSIIPPPSLGPALEQSSLQAPNNRFGHSSVMQSISPYTPPVPPPHHPMYYSTLPTERSFIEFARSYTGPGHLGYSNLMNSFPTSSPSNTANPYSFDRWPRMTLDQRAVSRYNSLYQSTTILPDSRAYTNYTSTRAPSFPAGLFPPPFQPNQL